MATHIDFLVEGGDFVFDAGGYAKRVSDRASIAQDVKHRVIESGLLHLLVAQRSPLSIGSILGRLIIEVEKDARLEPGTVNIFPVNDTYFLTAKTRAFSTIEVTF